MKIEQITNDEFNLFTSTYPIYSLYQTTEYALTLNKENFDTILIGLRNESNIIIAATILLIEKDKKNKQAFAPRGFLLDYQDSNLLKIFTKEIKKYLNNLGIISVILNPMIVKATYDMKIKKMTKNNYYDIIFDNLKSLSYHHLGYNNYFEGIKPRFVALINIEKPYYMIFKGINKEYRTKIRSASKNGVEIYLGGEENLDFLYLQTKRKYPRDLNYFKNIYNYFKRNNNAELFYAKINTNTYLRQIQNEYNEENTKVLELLELINNGPENRAKYIEEKIKQDKILNQKKSELVNATRLINQYPNGIIAASALIIKNKKEVTLLMDGYDPKFKRFNAKHLLIWKLLEKYSNEGYSIFNLGGVTNPTLKDNKYQGLNNFKIGFGSTIVEYIGDLELITNKPLYLLEKSKLSIPNILKK